ncbi:MAG: ThiS family protein [Actinobacteria bacterium ADurb.BinA094]|nr:MAG: ThiS family protein [Actinobacteria bacterium ADurb.BinA094]
MPTSYVRLPAGMAAPGGGREVACHGATVGEVIDEAITVEPRMRARIFREDGRRFAGIFLNGRNINALDGMDTAVSDGDRLSVVPPLSGG